MGRTHKVANTRTLIHATFFIYMSSNRNRPDQDGTHRAAFDKNKKRIYATQTICGICGREVDFSFKYPHPLSPCIDHIIPIAKGGHPSDIENLQLAHWICNREKSDKLYRVVDTHPIEDDTDAVRLPLLMDWNAYNPNNGAM